MAVSVRRAGPDDLGYIDALRRRESENIGFLPLATYEAYVTGIGPYARSGHRIWIAETDGDPVGFLYCSPGIIGRAARIIQVCVQPDARRIEYGRALVRAAEAYAAAIQRPAVGAHVATDIEARAFWDALGYPVAGLLPGGARRGRILESRYRRLPCGLWTDR